MLVRIILAVGLALMLFAGGASLWQSLQGRPLPVAAGAGAETAAEPDAAPRPFAGLVQQAPPGDAAPAAQDWLISPGGGLVPGRVAAAVLRQGAFVGDRRAELRLTLPVAALLAPGEAPPAPVFAGVFADIRAPLLALDLCRPLLDSFAAGCRVASARADGDSYDPATGTATFRIALDFAQKPGTVPLPDLMQHALYQEALRADLPGATPAAALALAAAQAVAVCDTVQAAGRACRITGLSLDWRGPGAARMQLDYAWFAPLPQGMFPAPPLPAATQ